MDLDTFHKHPKAEQTYDNFKTDLLLAYKIHKKNLTLVKAGYQSANATVKIKDKTADNRKDPILKPTNSRKDVWYCWSHCIMHKHMTNPDVAHNSDISKRPC